MILVGLTGGIGSGKSTVSTMLVERGAILIDADHVVRDVQRPGSPVLAAIAERFGLDVIGEGGELDRAALASVAFGDPDALTALNKIVHPAVGAEMARIVGEQVATHHVVVLDIPLLTENPRDNLQAKIVVDAPEAVQVERLVRYRGFDEADARARIGRQATREQRLDGADFVIDNRGVRLALEPQVDRLWAWLITLPQLSGDFDFAAKRSSNETQVDARDGAGGGAADGESERDSTHDGV